MILAMHTLIYSDDPDATRAFFRDVLGFPFVDTGDGWLIFKTGPSELGIHPSSGEHDGEAWSTPTVHEISLPCDDIEATIADLGAKGAVFTRAVRDDGWGLTVDMAVPGAGSMMVYQPRHRLVALMPDEADAAS